MATVDESPRNLNTVLNHIVESNVDSSRGAIKADLAGKIVYDDPNVFRRLRVCAHEDRLVNRCAESLKTDYAVDIKLLKELVAKASFKSVEKLEQEEKEDMANDQEKNRRSGNHGSVEEKKMYAPLVRMFEDTETLVRVVCSLAYELTINEIGLDPTVKLLTDEETKALTGQNAYPSAVVSCAGRDLCTIGPPIWSSVSLLGRGTNVWCTKEYVLEKDQIPRLRGNKMIMKTAWRNSGRTPESDIYRAIEEDQYPKGLARFEFGGDVLGLSFRKSPPSIWELPPDIGMSALPSSRPLPWRSSVCGLIPPLHNPPLPPPASTHPAPCRHLSRFVQLSPSLRMYPRPPVPIYPVVCTRRHSPSMYPWHPS